MRCSKSQQVLQFLDLHSPEGLTWKELIGKHTLTSSSASIDLFNKTPDQALPSALASIKSEVVELDFPRQTLDRALKALIASGEVVKLPLPKQKGKSGRPPAKYKIALGRRMFVKHPAKFIDHKPFFGYLRHRNSRLHVVLWPHEKEKLNHLCQVDPSFAKAVHRDNLKRKRGCAAR